VSPWAAVVPSPKVQLADMMTPSESVELAPFSVIDVSVWVSWSGPAFATGGWFGRVVLVVVGTGELVVLARLVDEVVEVLVLEVDVVGPTIVVVGVPVPIVAVAESPAADHVPRLSCTHRFAENVPVVAYVWATVGVPTVAEPPSPNCHQ